MSTTSTERYNSIAILLHWVMAALIIGMLILGKYMSDFVPDSELALKFSLFQWHKSFGITVLLLAILRLAWRLGHAVPPLPDNLKSWERAAAKLTHVGFYVLIIALPLSGWAMTSASPYNIPTWLFNTIPWPHMPFVENAGNKEQLEGLFKSVHFYLGNATILLLILHLGAVAKHVFVLRDKILLRMWPFGQN